MRTTDRDRCGYCIVAVSLALILLVQGAAALDATFIVGENGTWYHGDVMVEGVSSPALKPVDKGINDRVLERFIDARIDASLLSSEP